MSRLLSMQFLYLLLLCVAEHSNYQCFQNPDT